MGRPRPVAYFLVVVGAVESTTAFTPVSITFYHGKISKQVNLMLRKDPRRA